MNGTVKRVFLTRGFGFIKGDDGVDRFFHADGVITRWELFRQDQRVSFDPITGGRGLRAINVVIAETTEVAHVG